jgi:glucose-1-phosphate adenylyltransferase
MVRRCVLHRGVRVHTGAIVEDSVIFDNCDIGRHCRIRRAILDKNIHIQPGTKIGYNRSDDERLYHVSDSGIVVVEGLRSNVPIARVVV